MKKFAKLIDFQEVALSNENVSRILGGATPTRYLTYGGYDDIIRDSAQM